MKVQRTAPALISALVLAACTPAEQQEPVAEQASATEQAEAPSIEGTYRLTSRDLPDGTTLVPPEVIGLITYTKQYRNFNILWTNAEGKRFSLSYIAEYTLSPTEYGETSTYRIINDEIGGSGLAYDLSGPSGTSAVTIDNGRIEFQLPLYDEPTLVFEGDKLTATIEAGPYGEFIDNWERVE